ncbi:XylR family transcriptional regulator [Lignipirellula cremea]|uniref:Xylose operon regulatory protein n=1 Tax=Lignipirellula cremea TaxID=2528010 RepID=A0A518DLW1_9BACT|nr:XylR family transcriptional regulator [Lignipirellula cremea]QDU92812.1 Xylose operon regulatory protein [Lignipirellula cremea]
MPDRPKHVALLIETSREYGRGLLRGVTRFHHENASWSIYFKPQGLGEPPPEWLRSWRGDGILARIDDRRMAERVLSTGLPVVDLRGALADLGVPSIGVDNRSVAKIAFEHLLDRGLRHFAFCGVPPGKNRFDDQRSEFFRQEVEATGRPCHLFDRWRHWANWERGQQQIADWLRELPKPVGVMTCHDDRGQQVLDACRRLGARSPDDVAVIGVDNDSFLCNLALPPLTSIDVDAERNGFEASSLLDRMMTGEAAPETPLYFPARRIVTRQSTDTIAVDDPDVAAVARFIRDHACRGVGITEALAQSSLSRSTLTRRFKALLHRTPIAQLTHVRLEHARQLLLETQLPMTAIAARCGFNEAKYFIEVFHRQVGVTPGSFRRDPLGQAGGAEEKRDAPQ